MSIEPIALVEKTSGRVVGFACGKCGRTSEMMFPQTYLGTHEEQLDGARRAAAEHCGPLFCACGNERKQNYTGCTLCDRRRFKEALEATKCAAFAKAEKVAAADWDGAFVYSDRFQELFGEIGELIERYKDAGEEPPVYVYECERVDLAFDAAEILDNAFERQDAWDGARDHVSPIDEKEFQAVLDGWLKQREFHWWREAHRRAVLLPRPDATTAVQQDEMHEPTVKEHT